MFSLRKPDRLPRRLDLVAGVLRVHLNRRSLLGTVVAIAALLVFSLTVAAQGQRPAFKGKSSADPPPSIIFTYNGRQISNPITAPQNANDFEVFWKHPGGRCTAASGDQPVVVTWTFQALAIAGDPPLAPCLANEVRIDWQSTTSAAGTDNVIVKAWWTVRGKILFGIQLPNHNLINSPAAGPSQAPAADDACFALSDVKGGIGGAAWTRDGNVMPGGGIPIPSVPGTTNKANDVCWYGYTTG